MSDTAATATSSRPCRSYAGTEAAERQPLESVAAPLLVLTASAAAFILVAGKGDDWSLMLAGLSVAVGTWATFDGTSC